MNPYAKIIIPLLFVAQLGWSQDSKVSPELMQKVKRASARLLIPEPNDMDPVTLNATLVWSADKSQLAVVMKVDVLTTWHIYAHVPRTQPYIASELELDLCKGVSPIGSWEKPSSKPYDEGIYVYDGELIFVQYCSVASSARSGKISCGLYYQTCDVNKCFPPQTKSKQLSL